MQLFFTPTSPYARKVRVVVRELALTDRVRETPVDLAAAPADLRAANPLGKVPTLLRQAGEPLYDSPVICEYLLSLVPQQTLLAAGGDARWQSLRRAALADGLMDATVNIVLEQRRPEELRSRAMLDRWQAAIGRGVAAVEKETLDGAVELGRLALACALEYLDLRLPDWAWRADHPRTAAWLTGFAARPSLRATAPV